MQAADVVQTIIHIKIKLYRKDRNYLLCKRRDVNRVIDSPVMFV